MNAKDLSILIPARNEMFLAKTIEDILSNIEADTEVIAVMDGQWSDPGIPQNERANVIYLPESIGQRAATNMACRLSKAKYVMKVDAHCAFDKGFDRKMLEAFRETGDNVTMVPTMRNLHAFDWVCPDGHRRYQSPSGPCKDCGKETTRDVVWIPKIKPQSNSYCFDSEPHFQYFNEYTKRPGYGGELTESMSIQGSCFMVTKEKYWELNLSDESFGSWGSQGIEVACKTWLSGGRVIINRRTWYAHLFRTQGGDFSFPYPQKEHNVQAAKKKAKDLFFNNQWPKQKYPLSWLLEKFWPVKGWTQEDLDKLKKVSTDLKTEYDPSKNNIPGWMEESHLLWLFNMAKEMDSIVEIGSWKGRSAHALLSGCKGTVYAVDHFLGSVAEQELHAEAKTGDIHKVFMENVGHFKNLRVLKMDNAGAAKKFKDKSVDMVFIDGGHTYEEVLADIKRWLPKTKKMICGHDWLYSEVQRAVKEVFGDNIEVDERDMKIWFKRII